MFAVVAAATIGVASARAADCGDSAAGFNEWLASFKEVAIRNGVSPQVADAALNSVTYQPSVSAHDRSQGFGQSFAAFSSRHATPALIKKGKTMMLAYAEPFQKIEQRYGVPAPVLAAIWDSKPAMAATSALTPPSAPWRRSHTTAAGRRSIALNWLTP